MCYDHFQQDRVEKTSQKKKKTLHKTLRISNIEKIDKEGDRRAFQMLQRI